MRHRLCFVVVLLVCGDLLSCANRRPIQSDGHKSSTIPTSATESESLPKVCNQTNPPLCDTPPLVISQPPSTFSKPAGTNIHGVCVLSVIVEPNGRTSHIRVMKSVDWDLDQEAVHAVTKWRFTPATLNGKPVAVQIAVEVAIDIM